MDTSKPALNVSGMEAVSCKIHIFLPYSNRNLTIPFNLHFSLLKEPKKSI